MRWGGHLTAKFVPKGWHQATVPTTVVAALVKDKTRPDPYFGVNLRQFPGSLNPVGGNFSNIPMTPDSPYAGVMVGIAVFLVPATYKGKTVWLNFKALLPRQHLAEWQTIATSNDVPERGAHTSSTSLTR